MLQLNIYYDIHIINVGYDLALPVLCLVFWNDKNIIYFEVIHHCWNHIALIKQCFGGH